MPFTEDQVAQRYASLHATRIESERRQQEAVEAQREKVKVLTRLKSEYSDIPEDDLWALWSCAVRLTDSLVEQYVAGKNTLADSKLDWASLFYYVDNKLQERFLSTRRDALTKMARSYNDIGQTFIVEPVSNHKLPRNLQSTSEQVRISCTAPVPTGH